MTDALAQPYPERIAELERKLEITRQQYVDADHGANMWHAEVRRLRSEASELMAENAGLIQCNDALKRDKAELHQQIAWHVENAKQQAERIRELEAEVERAKGLLTAVMTSAPVPRGMIDEVLGGQHDLPPTRAETEREMANRIATNANEERE